jgi:hypothetical protein
MHRKSIFAFLLSSVLLLACTGSAQTQSAAEGHATELKAEVPELREFHSVIFEIWHGAWPKKDTKQLTDLLPKVEAGVQSVAGAQLPGILRERKGAWEQGVKNLQAITEEYKKAAEEKNQQNLLDAAEKLHSQYERLVRVIRPALKELEEFHTVLYMLYHYYLPGDSLDQMKSSAAALKEKMASLEKATLPERLKSKEPAFFAAREKLSKSVNALATTAQTDDLKKIKAAVATMHTDYQALEKVFD